MGLGSCATYLPLGIMTVEAGLGSTVTPTFPTVDVEVELDVGYVFRNLHELVFMTFQRTRRRERGMWSETGEEHHLGWREVG